MKQTESRLLTSARRWHRKIRSSPRAQALGTACVNLTRATVGWAAMAATIVALYALLILVAAI